MNDNDVDLDRLLTGVEDYLARARCAPEQPMVDGSSAPAFAYWKTTTRITTSEIEMLRWLEMGPVSVEKIAQMLGRTDECTRELLDALTAIGVVVRVTDGYTNSEATHRYLQAVSQEGGEKRTAPG